MLFFLWVMNASFWFIFIILTNLNMIDNIIKYCFVTMNQFLFDPAIQSHFVIKTKSIIR